jgi:hypothetical protein
VAALAAAAAAAAAALASTTFCTSGVRPSTLRQAAARRVAWPRRCGGRRSVAARSHRLYDRRGCPPHARTHACMTAHAPPRCGGPVDDGVRQRPRGRAPAACCTCDAAGRRALPVVQALGLRLVVPGTLQQRAQQHVAVVCSAIKHTSGVA